MCVTIFLKTQEIETVGEFDTYFKRSFRLNKDTDSDDCLCSIPAESIKANLNNRNIKYTFNGDYREV